MYPFEIFLVIVHKQDPTASPTYNHLFYIQPTILKKVHKKAHTENTFSKRAFV